MKKFLLGATACLSMVISVSKAQNIQPCGTYQAQEYFIKNLPGYKEQLAENEAKIKQFAAQKTSSVSPTDTITIPIVFHVLHQNGPENIADGVLQNVITYINSDYAKLGADTTTIDPLFAPLYKNSYLRFTLAQKDPQGNCTNGIVRHYDANTDWAQANLLGYQYSTPAVGNWNPSKYLNIYIVKQIIDNGGSPGIIVGYTYKPGTAPIPSADAIVYRYDFLNNFLNVRSMSHEIGHWLGLSHTFGNTNNPGTDCGDDGVLDTPPTKGYFSTCPSVTNDTLCDVINHLRPNIQNIMDYSGCPRMFTQGQIEVMRGAAVSSIASRSILTSTINLVNTTGVCAKIVADTIRNAANTADSIYIYNYPLLPAANCAPIADFASNKTVSCMGQQVVFTSTSYNADPSAFTYTWNFEGGSPSTSSAPTETVMYTTPGSYSVSLTVTNANGSNTETRTGYVYVKWNSDTMSFPYSEGFENGLPINWNSVNADANSPGFKLGNYGSLGTSKGIVLENFGEYAPGQVDTYESDQFNFTNVDNISMSFDYTYARFSQVTSDYFAFQYSTDCGGTWTMLPSSPTAASLASTSGGTVNTGAYIPFSPSKWTTKTFLTAVINNTLKNKPDVKFRFYFRNDDGGETNNMYFDNINISGIVGLEELENTIGLSIYPNPTSASSVVEFTSPVDSKVNVLVHDVTGRLIEVADFKANANVASKYEVNKSNQLHAGVYFVTLNLDGQKVTKKLIIQ